METAFCIEAVEEALARYGKPDIFNTDQGSQFTSIDFTAVLKKVEIEISMDGKGAWRDNVFVERLWRSIKYEGVYLHAYKTAVIGVLTEHVEREEERLRLEREQRYKRMREEERLVAEQRLLSGADCKWTQLGKAPNWYCRTNGRTFRLMVRIRGGPPC